MYLIPQTNPTMKSFGSGWGNGYVCIPKGHPLYEKPYSEIDNIEIHGGLTYSQMEGEWWVIGFDTCHSGDDETTCPLEYVLNETKSLLEQVEKLSL